MSGPIHEAMTSDRLTHDLLASGLTPGRAILVHCSFRRIGPTVDGPQTLLQALQAAAGPEATVVVPAHTSSNSTTSPAYQEATRELDADQLAEFRSRMPGFDPMTSPSYRTGAFAEFVRQQPGAVRSTHPQTSFAALGPQAAELMAVHDLDCHLGERSPLAALYDAHALIVLLGVGYESCTALHFAEHRLPWPIKRRIYQCYVARAGERLLLTFMAPDLHDGDFARIGVVLDDVLRARVGHVGDAVTRVLPFRDVVDHGVAWMSRHRTREGVGATELDGPESFDPDM